MDRRALGLVLLLTCAVYAPLARASYVYEDAHSLSGYRWAVPGRGLTLWTLQGQTARSAHIGNVLIHLGNGVLVAALGTALVSAVVGLAAASVFLLHPLNSEAVSYVSARTDLLSTFWMLLACWAALRGGWAFGLMALALGLAALSSEMGLLGAGFVLLTLVTRVPFHVERRLATALCGALGLVVGVTWHRIAQWLAMDGGSGGTVFSWPAFLAHQTAAMAHVWSFVLWPVGLSIDHDALVLSPIWTVLGVLLLISGIAVAWRTWPRWPLVAWTVGWVALSLAPRFVFATNEWYGEKDTYLAMPAVSLALGASLVAVATYRQECFA